MLFLSKYKSKYKTYSENIQLLDFNEAPLNSKIRFTFKVFE